MTYSNFLQTVVSSASTAEAQVFTLGAPPYRIVHVNEAWTHLCGFTSAEAVGQTCKIMQGPATEPDNLRQLHALIRDMKPARVRLTNYTKAGVPFVCELLVTPLTDELGSVSHFVGTLYKLGEPEPVVDIPKYPMPLNAALAQSAITAAFLGSSKRPVAAATIGSAQSDDTESEGASSRAGQSAGGTPLLSRQAFPLDTLNNHPIAPVLLRQLRMLQVCERSSAPTCCTGVPHLRQGTRGCPSPLRHSNRKGTRSFALRN